MVLPGPYRTPEHPGYRLGRPKTPAKPVQVAKPKVGRHPSYKVTPPPANGEGPKKMNPKVSGFAFFCITNRKAFEETFSNPEERKAAFMSEYAGLSQEVKQEWHNADANRTLG